MCEGEERGTRDARAAVAASARLPDAARDADAEHCADGVREGAARRPRRLPRRVSLPSQPASQLRRDWDNTRVGIQALLLSVILRIWLTTSRLPLRFLLYNTEYMISLSFDWKELYYLLNIKSILMLSLFLLDYYKFEIESFLIRIVNFFSEFSYTFDTYFRLFKTS